MADSEVLYTGGPAPPWLDRNAWYIPVEVPQEHIDKMPKIALHRVELKVNMCCKKCAEIVDEEIRYLGGVFKVSVDQKGSKVTVTGRPDPDRVLKRARKVDKHATFWPLPPPPPPAPPVVVVVEEEKPAEPETPAEPEKPAEPETPAEPEKPAEPETPAEPEKPAEEPEKPKEEEKPAEEEKPKEEEKPAEEAKPAEPEKPAEEPEKPKEEEKPPEEAKPAEPEKPAEEPEKPKDEPVAAAAQFPPFQYSTYEGYPGPYGFEYRPSQDYQRLYPSDYNYMGFYGPSVPVMNPNYLKHVKIAY